MPSYSRIDDLPAKELASLIANDTGRLTEEQATAVEDFIRRIGGIENAWLAIDMLNDLEWSA